MRKHFYLITAHENTDRVGGISIFDSRHSRSLKNEEEPITVLDEESEGFREVGRNVYLGYHDFESESEYDDEEFVGKIITHKIRSVDREWAAKAGVESQAYGEEATA